MIEFILEIPMDLKIILGTGVIMILYEIFRKKEVWEEQQKNQQ
jgi:hypothetical protein